ncbi:hypothetical protein ASF73_04970 [Xanthomonas sp. Leaf131]|nr:hypothetical protein ASF73_04970 [Xanthomonas sp. Leaf131]
MIGHLVYWISTALLLGLYALSATMYLLKGQWTRQALADLGYPGYLVPTLVVAKVAAVVAILSRFDVGLSDLAYAGVFYHLLLSALAYVGVRKLRGATPALLCLVLLVASFMTQNLARDLPSPYVPDASSLHARPDAHRSAAR